GSRADGYAGITLGLIGLGRIGSRIATLMRPWKMRILAADPYVPAEKFTEHGVTRVDLPTLLRESDVVRLHFVLTRAPRPTTHAGREGAGADEAGRDTDQHVAGAVRAGRRLDRSAHEGPDRRRGDGRLRAGAACPR